MAERFQNDSCLARNRTAPIHQGAEHVEEQRFGGGHEPSLSDARVVPGRGRQPANLEPMNTIREIRWLSVCMDPGSHATLGPRDDEAHIPNHQAGVSARSGRAGVHLFALPWTIPCSPPAVPPTSRS